MATLTCKFVRPDKLVYEGEASQVTLITASGELGVYPGHASEICALGEGVMRMTVDGETRRIIIMGGYAEISDDTIVMLADHARRVDDVDPEVTQKVKDDCQAELAGLPDGDSRRAFIEHKIHWCDMLLKFGEVS